MVSAQIWGSDRDKQRSSRRVVPERLVGDAQGHGAQEPNTVRQTKCHSIVPLPCSNTSNIAEPKAKIPYTAYPPSQRRYHRPQAPTPPLSLDRAPHHVTRCHHDVAP